MKKTPFTLCILAFSLFEPLRCSESAGDCFNNIECYPPQYCPLDCDLGFFVTADFLYWYARENDLAWGTRVGVEGFGGVKTVAIPHKHLQLDAGWSPGSRFGIGWKPGCNGWDFYLNWLYLHHTNRDDADFSRNGDSQSEASQEAIYNPWAYGSVFPLSFWQKGKAKWKLNFDQMDLELGRKYLLSSCFSLRPYAGLRGTWMHTRFHVYTESTLPGIQFSPNFNAVFQSNTNLLKNHYWGVGPMAGLQPDFIFCRNLILYSNFGGSLVWGKFWGANVGCSKVIGSFNDTPQNFDDISYEFEEKEAFYRMQAMLDLSIGLRWEENWCCNRFRTSLDIGWENLFWLNFGLHHQSTGSYNASDSTSYYMTENDLITDLTLGGLVVRFRLDF